MVDIRRPAAVNGVADGGVFGQLVLQVHHRLGAPDEQDGAAVVQPPHLIWGQQFTATLSSGELKFLDDIYHQFDKFDIHDKMGIVKEKQREKARNLLFYCGHCDIIQLTYAKFIMEKP